jgi:hypothetical protein
MELAQIVAWLKTTQISEATRYYPWVWPICETLHFIGLSLLVGVIGLLDVRLLGFFRRVPIAALRKLLPYGIVGFVVNLITGVIFVIGAPEQYIHNVAFYYKLLFLLVAGANALLFELLHGRRLAMLTREAATPAAFKLAGAVSLLSWFMVLYWGRMLPFIGDAF